MEDLHSIISKFHNNDVDYTKIVSCNLSKGQLEKIGHSTFIKWSAKLEEECLLVSSDKITFSERFFGVYCVFTCETQHFYAKEKDIYYILGMAKYYKDKKSKTVDTFYSDFHEKSMELSYKKAFKHMKEVCSQCNIIIPKDKNTYKKLENYLDHNFMITANYFFHYRMGCYMKYDYEFLLGIR